MELKDKEYLIRVTEFDGLEFDGISFTQNDTNTCRLNFELIEEVDRATIVIDKNDNTQIIDELTHVEGNKYYYDMPISTINVVGTHKAYLMTYGHSDDRRTLGMFKYKITAEPSIEDIATTTEYPLLTKLISDVTALELDIKTSEDIRVQNEGNRVSNENTRIEKEITRDKEFDVIKKDYDTYKKVMIAESNVAALQSQINETNSSLETIVRQDVEIDVINPPKQTGLLPLTLTDVAIDTTRLQAIFDYIKNNEYTFQPNSKQYFGYTYTVRFPKGVITLNNTITIKGQYINIIGDSTIIKVTHANDVFYLDGYNGRKAHYEGLIFSNCKTAFNYNIDKIDTCMIDFERCFFTATTDVAIKFKGESTMLEFNRCHFYQCRFIFDGIDPDYTLFKSCWFSESPRLVSGEASFTLKGRFSKFQECFFIPNGLSNTGESSLTDLAWINSYQSIEIESCRVSSEPNSKTLINNYANASLSSPYKPQSISVKNCLQLSHELGQCTVRLFNIPNRINISENSFIRSADVAIQYASSFNYDTWLTNNSGANNSKINISLLNNIGQANSNWINYPSELLSYMKNNEVENKLEKKNTLITSAINGTFTNTFKIDFNITKSSRNICNNNYIVKMSWQPDTTSVNMRSVYVGMLSFIGYRNGSNVNAIKVALTPLVSLQGGNQTNQATPIVISALVNGLDNYLFTDSGNVSVDLTVTSICQGNGIYEIKEIMDGQFLV